MAITLNYKDTCPQAPIKNWVMGLSWSENMTT